MIRKMSNLQTTLNLESSDRSGVVIRDSNEVMIRNLNNFPDDLKSYESLPDSYT